MVLNYSICYYISHYSRFFSYKYITLEYFCHASFCLLLYILSVSSLSMYVRSENISFHYNQCLFLFSERSAIRPSSIAHLPVQSGPPRTATHLYLRAECEYHNASGTRSPKFEFKTSAHRQTAVSAQ